MISSIWTLDCAASTRLGITRLIDDEWRPEISIEDTTITDGGKIFRSLRQAYPSAETARLAAARHQSKTFHCCSLSKTSSPCHREGDFARFAEWRFIHHARLADAPLNGYNFKRSDAERLCRWCHKQVETLSHVLNHCLQYMPSVTRRHCEPDKLAAVRRWTLLSENQPIGSQGLRPDLVIRIDNGVLILDVTCHFENGGNSFLEARKEKERTYTGHVQ